MPFVIFFELFGRVLYVQFPYVTSINIQYQLVVPEPLPAWEPPRGWGPARAHELERLPSPELAPEEEPELIDLDDVNRRLPEVPWLLDENWEPVR
ncbi:hypothetical protein B0A54_10300 [Friedmanniomyces endolithicus]|uniref:Uncharacterized protein n=1 Tax=Friedmanniomyces endolithicus TaxID=329885 RepID=A0A4V5N7R0_9PEZI|nr:hypothetical protein LTS09_009494 [Friedmanniomyces endolithicus]TKA39949.1 hypothetical protein B0A54_10300 [Friedmanniomyces endolithicus]